MRGTQDAAQHFVADWQVSNQVHVIAAVHNYVLRSFKILQTMIMVSLKQTVELTHMVAVVDTSINIINHLMFM